MKAPGHQKFPDHKVEERPLTGTFEVDVGDARVAQSQDVLRLEEDGHPPRLYFPRAAIAPEKLSPSSTTTHCPFKGTAHYFNLDVNGRTLPDAVWSYEEPYDEHQALKGRLAFYDDKYREIHVHASA